MLITPTASLMEAVEINSTSRDVLVKTIDNDVFLSDSTWQTMEKNMNIG